MFKSLFVYPGVVKRHQRGPLPAPHHAPRGPQTTPPDPAMAHWKHDRELMSFLTAL